MAMIDHKIGASRLEVIPAAIYSILSTEFTNQVYQFQNDVCAGVKFFSERTEPLDKTEGPCVIIQTYKGDYDDKSALSTHARPYLFVLDVMTNAKSTAAKKGYQSAHERLLKLIGIIRYILEHPNYSTLLFTTPFIEHTGVKGFQIYKDERADTAETAAAQIMFEVRCEESELPNTFPFIAGSDTAVYISLTTQGYMYGTEFSPPIDPHYVYIVDQDDNVLTQVAGGNKYTVTVLKNIIDTIISNQTNIIDNILPE